jgi:hypothetical protein
VPHPRTCSRMCGRCCWCAGWKSESSSIYPHSKICVRSLAQDVVDPGLRVQANRAVRVDPLVRNDLVRTICAQEPAFMMLSYEGHYCP